MGEENSGPKSLRDMSMSELLGSFSFEKKKKPKLLVVKEEGATATLEVGRGYGIFRKRDRGSVQTPPSGVTDLSVGNSRPKRPDKIIQGEE